MTFLRCCLPIVLLAASASCTRTRPYPSQICLSPDQRTIALFSPTAESGRWVAFVDRGIGTIVWSQLPDSCTGDKLLWLGRNLYITARTGDRITGFILDRDSRQWTPAPCVSTVWYPPFVGRFNGQPALFQPSYGTTIRALTDLSVLATLDYPLRGLSDGYALRYQWPDGPPMTLWSDGWLRETHSNPDGSRSLKPVPITGLDLLDPDLKPRMNLASTLVCRQS